MSKAKMSAIHILLALVFVSVSALPVAAQKKIWVTAYYGGWEQGSANNGYMPTQDVDFTAMTVVAHMSLSLRADGSLDAVSNSITEINSESLITAAHASGTRAIITIGGWNTESRFMGSTSPQYFGRFVANIVGFVKERGYDGVDIDWEPLKPPDTTRFAKLVRALRANLPSPQYLLTTTAGYRQPYAVFAHVQDLLDQINIMTYDLSWPSPGCLTWFNSAVYGDGVTYNSNHKPVPACNLIVKEFLQAGVKSSKLGIGAELAGFVWRGGEIVDARGNATGNGATGPGQEWEGYMNHFGSPYAPSVAVDVPLYSFDGKTGIMREFYQPDWYHWDAGAQVSYLSINNPGSANDYFISYDDARSIAAKFAFVEKEHLGGIIIYELGMGYPGNGSYPLLRSIKEDMIRAKMQSDSLAR